MFAWLKKLVSGPAPPAASPDSPRTVPQSDLRQTLQVATVWQVVDRFLTQNPAPTPLGVHALVDAGAANLLDASELIQVCEKIQEHGYQFPINPTLINELKPPELLEFLRWHQQHDVEPEYYANEATIRELIERFRASG
ncbi:hypothetical protein [Stieleria mannarensis]|uniref:hypothetical protein n=1 Tax=Stieleria mannarensis TaxID=2755585 RepID=UPI0016045B3F|nr:hypothetical protein [Rhodopirellula sp. JC639]